MLNVAVLDDYQNIFEKIINVDSLSNKFKFTIFNHPIINESEAIVSLKEFEALFIMRERTPITKTLIENLPNLKYIITSGMRNNAIDLVATKQKKNNSMWN